MTDRNKERRGNREGNRMAPGAGAEAPQKSANSGKAAARAQAAREAIERDARREFDDAELVGKRHAEGGDPEPGR